MNDQTKKPVMNREARRERRRQIAKAVKSGRSLLEVAREFGVTTEQVRRACFENGFKLVRRTVVVSAA